jgi:hypothetical protein
MQLTPMRLPETLGDTWQSAADFLLLKFREYTSQSQNVLQTVPVYELGLQHSSFMIGNDM